ncbi:OmpA family protein [Phenylobacterium sp.]|uniref:OmpA family protein n=1 Tax=Phenylobacterium sp. TaxID=1871053 RepID=UPI00273285E9|nr:OmpA family protein [Phenylobacterium sp.]MDP3854846.1 OmpA family protein [Phenylobacterium sp.]
MKIRKTNGVVIGALLLGALSLGGCATKKFVNEQVAVVDAKVAGHETRIGELDRTSREALERATAAGKLAEGKFMYTMVLSDDAVKFPLDQATLSPEAEERIAALAERLKAENRNVYVEVQGHTDATGTNEYNDKLGADRAEAVRRALNKQGVALNRMSSISYGEEVPVAPNNDRAGRSANRRVVLVVLS